METFDKLFGPAYCLLALVLTFHLPGVLAFLLPFRANRLFPRGRPRMRVSRHFLRQ